MAVNRDKRIIHSLQGLRTIAFIGVFLNHSIGGAACLGAAGVSLFLVLSGFLMAFSYWNREVDAVGHGFIGSLKFAWKKIRKLYPLHICMIVLVIAYVGIIGGYQKTMIPQLAGETALNILLLQAWIPVSEVYFSLNAVSWYLSTALFCYFVFPWLFYKLKKRCSIKHLLAMAAVLVILMCAVSALAAVFGSPTDKAWFSQHWMTYVFPATRLLDFSLGAIAGSIFMLKAKATSCSSNDRSEKGSCGNRLVWTIIELSVALLFAATVILFKYAPNWIKYSFIYILPSLGIVFILALEKGLLSRFLSLAPFRFIGEISAYAFLIHWLAIRITSLILHRLFPDIMNCFTVIIAFAVTVAASEIARRIITWLERFFGKSRSEKGTSGNTIKEAES